MLNSLSTILVANCRDFLAKAPSSIVKDVYAVSLYTNLEDVAQAELILSCNTYTQIAQSLSGATAAFGLPSTEEEAKWNFAFWLQTPNLRLLVPPDSADGTLWRQLLGQRDLVYTDLESFDVDLFEAGVRALLQETAIQVAQAMHKEGVLRGVFGKDLPVIIHDLEYDDSVADLTEKANPIGLAAEFCNWVRAC